MSPGDLFSLLSRVDRALRALERDYALIGGMAVSVKAEPRFTRDADVAVSVADDGDAEALVRALRPFDLVPFEVLNQEATGRLAAVRLRTTAGAVCDMMFAHTGIEAQIVQAADLICLMEGLRVPVARPEHLAAMKTLSARVGRPQDRMDLRSILTLGVDHDAVRRALDDITAAGCHRGQDLRAKLARLVAELDPPS